MNIGKGILVVASAAGLTFGMAGCSDGSSVQQPPKPKDSGCQNWKFDDQKGVWKCQQSNAGHAGAFYYGNRYYSSANDLTSSSAYKSYKSSSSFAGEGASHASVSEGGFGGHASAGGE